MYNIVKVVSSSTNANFNWWFTVGQKTTPAYKFVTIDYSMLFFFGQNYLRKTTVKRNHDLKSIYKQLFTMKMGKNYPLY